MASKTKNLSSYESFTVPRAGRYKIGLVVSEYHHEITEALKEGALQTLKDYGVKEKNICVESVPGAFELPLAAKWLKEAKKLDAVLCLGCVIRGETAHDVYINHAVADAVMQLGLQTGFPFVFGLLTPNNAQQAKDRAGGKYGNKGVECAVAALKMIALKEKIKKSL